ncbi:phosphoribosyltransferase family protein [Dorea ammoniilytica]|uniref:Phosphoribosyltransferase family protein n=1 Tax=Dorea ammoniilytica TaxID=2981788 RepID=A0ABT2S8R9_9FIRM|nr:phosphoribosyltransferase family protein [Dorea ammoniilytica]MCU6700982.1 phosphoribosyltransferase family protein [Dorea ammoniilytica]SCI11483.1 Xanthine phosphoribosyltransferase [uncultured Eubacterium sp.]
MKTYNMTLCNVDRTLPFIPISEDMAFASFVVLGDTELVSACAPELVRKIGNVDAIVTAEAKGIALAYEVSRQLGLKEFIVARKSTKSYMKDVVSASVHSITTAGEQHLYLDGKDADKIRGKRVCLLDDVISTGESLHALECLMENAGAKVVKKAAILAEGDAADREDILFLQKLPLFRKLSDGEYNAID